MLSLEYRSFRIGKKVDSSYCEDSIAVSRDGQRIAVSDGVTNSFRPEFVSHYLVNTFVETNVSPSEWSELLSASIADSLNDSWLKRVYDFLNGYEGFGREIQELRWQKKGPGAATFCGVEFNLNEDCLEYAVLGDNCLFILPRDGNMDVKTSSEVFSESGKMHILFNSTPACIIAGNPSATDMADWRIGRLDITEGYVALMTDGVANWFTDKMQDEPNYPDTLWYKLENIETFRDYIIQSRNENPMSPLSDDITIAMVKVSLKPQKTNISEKFSAPQNIEKDTTNDILECQKVKSDHKEIVLESKLENYIAGSLPDNINTDINSKLITQHPEPETPINSTEQSTFTTIEQPEKTHSKPNRIKRLLDLIIKNIYGNTTNIDSQSNSGIEQHT